MTCVRCISNETQNKSETRIRSICDLFVLSIWPKWPGTYAKTSMCTFTPSVRISITPASRHASAWKITNTHTHRDWVLRIRLFFIFCRFFFAFSASGIYENFHRIRSSSATAERRRKMQAMHPKMEKQNGKMRRRCLIIASTVNGWHHYRSAKISCNFPSSGPLFANTTSCTSGR